MNRNFNLPGGVTASDISRDDECPTCEGGGVVEVPVNPGDQDGDEIPWHAKTQEITCPDCSGMGVVNLRTAQ